jgi:hypothetical protein
LSAAAVETHWRNMTGACDNRFADNRLAPVGPMR